MSQKFEKGSLSLQYKDEQSDKNKRVKSFANLVESPSDEALSAVGQAVNALVQTPATDAVVTKQYRHELNK